MSKILRAFAVSALASCFVFLLACSDEGNNPLDSSASGYDQVIIVTGTVTNQFGPVEGVTVVWGCYYPDDAFCGSDETNAGGEYEIERGDDYSAHDGHNLGGEVIGYLGYKATIINYNHNNIPYTRDIQL